MQLCVFPYDVRIEAPKNLPNGLFTLRKRSTNLHWRGHFSEKSPLSIRSFCWRRCCCCCDPQIPWCIPRRISLCLSVRFEPFGDAFFFRNAEIHIFIECDDVRRILFHNTAVEQRCLNNWNFNLQKITKSEYNTKRNSIYRELFTCCVGVESLRTDVR